MEEISEYAIERRWANERGRGLGWSGQMRVCKFNSYLPEDFYRQIQKV